MRRVRLARAEEREDTGEPDRIGEAACGGELGAPSLPQSRVPELPDDMPAPDPLKHPGGLVLRLFFRPFGSLGTGCTCLLGRSLPAL